MINYNKEAIRYALENYHMLQQSTETVDTKADLDFALSSTLLTSRERLALAGMFALELNLLQCNTFLDIAPTEMYELLETAFEKLEAIMNGYQSPANHAQEKEKSTTLEAYMANVDKGIVSIFDINTNVNLALIELLALLGNDVLAQEFLRQRTDGYVYESLNEYPCHVVASQDDYKNKGNDYFYNQDMNNGVRQHMDFNMPNPELFPTTGHKKSVFKTDDSINGGKQRLFA